MVSNPDEEAILKVLKKRKLSSSELESILKQFEQNPNPKGDTEYFSDYKGNRLKFGVISDTHIGHVNFDSGLMKHAVNTFNKEKVNFVVHGGDVCEGVYNSRREGHIFELEHLSGDEQVERAVKELSKIDCPIYGITGNHEYNTFFRMSGFEIGKQLEDRIKGFKYLGNGEGFIKLKNDITIQTMHPDQGSSYSISYRSQKIAESLAGGLKPNILLISHFHKLEYLFYRNIHILQTGTIQTQTKFMKGRHISAHKGFIIVDMEFGKKGIGKFSPTFYVGYKGSEY